MTGVNWDITERKAIEARIAARQQRLGGTVDELASRVTPQALMDQGKDTLKARFAAATTTPEGDLRVERIAAAAAVVVALVQPGGVELACQRARAEEGGLVALALFLGKADHLKVKGQAAAGAVPIIGAAFGATVNVIFMDHFQKIAKGHFTVRRLERLHGSAGVRQHYAAIAAGLGPRRGVATV